MVVFAQPKPDESCHRQVRKLLALIPDKVIVKFAQSTSVDYQVKKLEGRIMFYLLLYSLLDTERASLRSMADCYMDEKFQAYAGLSAGSRTKFNSLSCRLNTMNITFFEQLYYHLYREFKAYYPNPDQYKRFHIARVDSTMVSEAASKLEEGMLGGHAKSGKKQVKYTLCLEDLFPSSVELYTRQESLSEDKVLPELILKSVDRSKDNVVVFDMGVKSRDAFAKLDDENIWFVTRVNLRLRYEIGTPFSTPKNSKINGLILLGDDLVHLFDANKQPSKPYRLIRAKDPKGKIYHFLTNNLEEKTRVILDLYKKRWDIEVFFRFLKQELNLSHLMSMGSNGLKIVLYLTLILSLLILVFKKVNDIGYKTAKRRFKKGLENCISIIMILQSGGDPKLIFRDYSSDDS